MKKLLAISLGILIASYAHALPGNSQTGQSKGKLKNQLDKKACILECRKRVKAYCMRVRNTNHPCPHKGGAPAFCQKKCENY